MAIVFTEKEKKKFIDLIKDIDLKELAIPDEANRQWFKFGAYDALRIIAEKILGGEEDESKSKLPTRNSTTS